MSTYSRLNDVLDKSIRLNLNNNSKIVLMSDVHRGIGDETDDFIKNKYIYNNALKDYYSKGFTYIEIGDGDELWKNKSIKKIIDTHSDTFNILKKFYDNKRLYFIYGNHDMIKNSKRYLKRNLYRYYNENTYISLFPQILCYEGVILEYHDNLILLVHGHQGDIINDRLWFLAMFLVRYILKPIGINLTANYSISPAKNTRKKKLIERKMINWSNSTNNMIIAGHTHRSVFPKDGDKLYFNTGCCVKPGYITCIEIENNKIILVKWIYDSTSQNNISKEIIAGPKELDCFF